MYVCANIQQYDATLTASLHKLRTCLQHNLQACLLRAGSQRHVYCLIGLSRSQDSQLIIVARLQTRRTENRVSITSVDGQLCIFSAQGARHELDTADSFMESKALVVVRITTRIPLVPNTRNGGATPP
jgi:hypothetical protein